MSKLNSVLSHQFCIVTKYCKVCGQHRELVLYSGMPCLDLEQRVNVHAISHRRALEIGEQCTAEVISELDDELMLMDDHDLGTYVSARVDDILGPIEQRLKEAREKLYEAKED